MSGIPQLSMTNRSAGESSYMEELIQQNESLLLEVGHLRSVLREKGLDQLQRLREENEALHQKLKTAESQLEEKRHQLEVLESAYDRFDGVHASLRELAEQRKTLSEMQTQCNTLQEQNTALKTELVKLSTKEEETRPILNATYQQCVILQEEVGRLELELQVTKGSTNIINEAHTSALVLLSAIEQEAKERSRLRNSKHSEIEEAMQRLQEELRAAKIAMEEKEKHSVLALAEQKEIIETKIRQEAEEELKQKIAEKEENIQRTVRQEVEEELKKQLAEKEEKLQQVMDKNFSLMGQVEMIKAEKEAIMTRYGIEPSDIAKLKSRVEQLRDETSKKDALQQRFAAMLQSTTATNSDIKELFEKMLDFQESQEEEMRTQLLIQQIQADDMKKVYELNIKKLNDEKKNLLYQIKLLQDERKAARSVQLTQAATATPAPDTTPLQYPQHHQNQQQQLNQNSPSPAAPHQSPQRGGNTGPAPINNNNIYNNHNAGVHHTTGRSNSSVMEDLWRQSSPRMEAPQRHFDPRVSNQTNNNNNNNNNNSININTPPRHDLRRCLRCTYLNPPEFDCCEICRSSLS